MRLPDFTRKLGRCCPDVRRGESNAFKPIAEIADLAESLLTSYNAGSPYLLKQGACARKENCS
jgi:hypothetical protein